MADAVELVQRLEQGVQEVMSSEGWRRYLQTQARFHNYSAGNVLLILVQKPEAEQVAGFSTWRDLGRNVRKGEKGIQILAPVFPKRDKDEPKLVAVSHNEAGEEERREIRTPVNFRVAHVFDVSQTEGKPLPEPPGHRLEGDSDSARWLKEHLLEVAQAEGLTVTMDSHECGRANGFYRPSTKEIHVAAGLATDQQAKTLAHEIAHHMLEHGHGRNPDRSTKEAEAEGVAFVVCSRYGLDTSDYTFGYIAGWSGKQGVALVKEVGAQIQKTGNEIINRLEPELMKERTKEAEHKKPAERQAEYKGHRSHRTTAREPATAGLAR